MTAHHYYPGCACKSPSLSPIHLRLFEALLSLASKWAVVEALDDTPPLGKDAPGSHRQLKHILSFVSTFYKVDSSNGAHFNTNIFRAHYTRENYLHNNRCIGVVFRGCHSELFDPAAVLLL